MAQDDELKARMVKALQLARECLGDAHLLGPIMGRPVGQGESAILPTAILAAELFKHIESSDRPRPLGAEGI